MLKISDVQKDLNDYLMNKDFKKDKVEFYKTAIFYLETNPQVFELEKNIETLNKKLNILDSRFDEWRKIQRNLDEPRKEYEKINEYSVIRRQIKFFKYLLNQ